MKGNKHLIIPDTQCKEGVPMDHLLHIGDYIVDKKPDVVIHLGDHWDMPSLSSYDEGKKRFEGRQYKKDVDAGNRGMDLLMAPLEEYNAMRRRNGKKQYRPRLVFLLGNHEFRIERAVESDRKLEGTLGYHDFNLEDYGWEVHGFLEPVEIDGVHYAHYFYNPFTGQPYGGMPSTMLKNVGFSFTQGHKQGKQQAERYLSDGTAHRALIVGSCYQHEEDYKGPQANYHWRGIIVKHQVCDGDYDLMEVSLEYLRERWEKKYG